MTLIPTAARREMGHEPRMHRDRMDRLRKTVHRLNDSQLVERAKKVYCEKDVLVYIGEMVARGLIVEYKKRRREISVRFTGKQKLSHFWPTTD